MRKPRTERQPGGVSTGSLLGEWIRTARTEQGLSQRALADRSGLSRSYVCDIERGRGAEPSMATLDKLAAALGSSRAEVMSAAGLIDPVAKGHETDDERRLLAVFRDLKAENQASVLRFARFLQADEQRWTQPQLIDDGPSHEAHPNPASRGPMLFELND